MMYFGRHILFVFEEEVERQVLQKADCNIAVIKSAVCSSGRQKIASLVFVAAPKSESVLQNLQLMAGDIRQKSFSQLECAKTATQIFSVTVQYAREFSSNDLSVVLQMMGYDDIHILKPRRNFVISTFSSGAKRYIFVGDVMDCHGFRRDFDRGLQSYLMLFAYRMNADPCLLSIKLDQSDFNGMAFLGIGPRCFGIQDAYLHFFSFLGPQIAQPQDQA